VASAIIDGIATRYEVVGSGPPLLMYAPGGFNAVVETWSHRASTPRSLPIILRKTHLRPVDRANAGGPVGAERVTWAHYVAQGKDR
jgi:hypothetical protein